MNTLDRHLQHGPGLRAAGVAVLLDRGQQHPHQVDGVVEQRKRPADVPGARPGRIGQLKVGLVLLVVSPSGQIGEVMLDLFPDLPASDVSEVRRCRTADVGQEQARLLESVGSAAADRTAMAGEVVGWLAAA